MIAEKNKKFYDTIFPSIIDLLDEPKTEYRTNNIQFKSVLVYGKIGSGKTEMVRRIVEEAILRYGQENVSACINEEGELRELLDQGITDKLVNIIFVDNITLKKYDVDQLQRLFRVRQEIFDRTTRTNGLIVAILTTHRFHSGELVLRTNNDAIIIRDAPTNPYDKTVIKGIIGKDGLDQVEYYAFQRLKDKSFKRYSVFMANQDVGVLDTPMAGKNYMKEIQSLQALMDKVRAMQKMIK